MGKKRGPFPFLFMMIGFTITILLFKSIFLGKARSSRTLQHITGITTTTTTTTSTSDDCHPFPDAGSDTDTETADRSSSAYNNVELVGSSSSSRDYLHVKEDHPLEFLPPVTKSRPFFSKNTPRLGAGNNSSSHSLSYLTQHLLNKDSILRSRDAAFVRRSWKKYVKDNVLARQDDQVVVPYSFRQSTTMAHRPSKPKVIWTYWPGGEGQLSSILTACISSWRRYNPDHEVIVLSRSLLDRVFDFPLPTNFDRISTRHQIDWIKLAILLQEGGTWVEPSFVMTRSLEFLEGRMTGKQGILFFMDYYTFHPRYPFFQGYFISFVRGSTLLSQWFLEWSFCIEEHLASSSHYIDHLDKTFGESLRRAFLQGLPKDEFQDQLSLVALQKVLQLNDDLPETVMGISSFNYPYGPMYLQEQLDGSSLELVQSLLEHWDPERTSAYTSKQPPAYLYLRPADLDLLELQVVQGWTWFWQRFAKWNIAVKLHHQVHRGSFYCIYIKGLDLGCGGKIK